MRLKVNGLPLGSRPCGLSCHGLVPNIDWSVGTLEGSAAGVDLGAVDGVTGVANRSRSDGVETVAMVCVAAGWARVNVSANEAAGAAVRFGCGIERVTVFLKCVSELVSELCSPRSNMR